MMEYSITGSEVAELISCKKQDVYNSASYGQMIRKEFYVEVVDRPWNMTGFVEKFLRGVGKYGCRRNKTMEGETAPL